MSETPAQWWAKQMSKCKAKCLICGSNPLAIDLAEGLWCCARCHASGSAVSWLQLTTKCSPEAAQSALDEAGVYPDTATHDAPETETHRVHEALRGILKGKPSAWVVTQHIQHVMGKPQVSTERIGAILRATGVFRHENAKRRYDYRQSPSMRKALPDGCGLRGTLYHVQAADLSR